MDEAHVEHAIGFVKHQHLDARQVQGSLLGQIEQASGCRHQNVNALFDALNLGFEAHTPEHHSGLQREVFAVGANGFFYLGSQLTGGGEHQGANALAFGRSA